MSDDSGPVIAWIDSLADPLPKLDELLGKLQNPDACHDVAQTRFFQEHKREIVGRLVALLHRWKQLGSLKVCVIFYLMIELAEYHNCGIRPFLKLMVDNIWEQKGTEAHLPAVIVLYEVFLKQSFSVDDLALLDDLFIGYLFDLVEETRDFVDESLNRSLTKLILIISEQMSAHINRRPNPVMALVRQRMAGAKTFSENVAILFNRGGDLIETGTDDNLKLILLNFMFLTFQDKGTGVFFFINDLKVIIDATIRELNDLPPELEILRQGYCRVLYFILLNSEYRKIKYKKEDIKKTLEKTYGDELFDKTSRLLAEEIMVQCASILE